MRRIVVWLALLTLAWPGTAGAHPVPRKSHDRTIVVRLSRDAVTVEYRLEIDEWTVVFQDLPAVSDQVDLTKLSKPDDFYEAFTRGYAPILADNLVATLDGKPVTFKCVRRSHTVLDHLRCDFVFRAALETDPGRRHEFHLREGNYELEPGTIRLTLEGTSAVRVLEKTEADEALQGRPASELAPGDEPRLRNVEAVFEVTGEVAETTVPPPAAPPEAERGPAGLLSLLLDTRKGFWLLLLLSAGFGAVHALTPGHGKTLVAGYLVGQRGTAAHALVLGLVTTLTHTGAVLALAAVLLFLYPDAVPANVQSALGLGGGLLVAGMGLWLLLRRLSGGADHVHIGGPGHHHAPPPERVGWWGLVVMGMSGGIVPCWDAIAMFGFAVSAQRLWLALPLLLAFSAGLAGVLVAIGIAVVYARGFAASHWGESRVFRALPLLSATLVTGLGLWLCYDSVHTQAAPSSSAGGAVESR